MLSKRAQNLKTSPTLFLVAKAKELQAQGHDVISLTVGEPDWATFKAPTEAGIEAIQKNITKYTAANGTIELRKQLVEQFKKEIGITYSPAAITVGSGAKFIIFAALQVICDPGDEVIIQAPYWVSYPTMIELADGKPCIVECTAADNFKLSAKKLAQSITPKTKGFLYLSFFFSFKLFFLFCRLAKDKLSSQTYVEIILKYSDSFANLIAYFLCFS